jgi:hypothetical protein
MILPSGAKAIVESRKRGMKPADMLIISLVGETGESNHTIHANPEGQYDWRWLVGLNACIFLRFNLNWKPITMAIAQGKPHWLGLFDVDRFQGADVYALPVIEDIDKPADQWRHQLALFRWTQHDNERFAWAN